MTSHMFGITLNESGMQLSHRHTHHILLISAILACAMQTNPVCHRFLYMSCHFDQVIPFKA